MTLRAAAGWLVFSAAYAAALLWLHSVGWASPELLLFAGFMFGVFAAKHDVPTQRRLR